jgi:redox-sensitive bicupin YhaK (pirin superfamily)
MIQVRRSGERGHFDHGWLDTRHTFSFGDYYDPRFMGFRALRVLNEDVVQPAAGFGEHGHRDMEILSYVLEGALEHRDSLGSGAVLVPGELQRMTAGTGVVHSESNPSDTQPVHFYQVWLLPDRKGLAPGYEQRAFPEEPRRGRLHLAASPNGRDGSLTIHQDALVFLASLDAGQQVAHPLRPGRHAWLQVLRGEVTANGHALAAGDGAAVSGEQGLEVEASTPAEVMLFDLA